MRKKEDKKLIDIIDATIALTSEVGIAGLKMSLIAKRANIATGTIYTYYKNKNELLNIVYTHLKSNGLFALMGKIDHLPIHAQLYKLWEIAFDYHVSDHSKSLFMEQFEVSTIISQENKNLEENALEFLNKTIDEAKKLDIIKNIDNYLITSLIIGFLRDLSLKIKANNLEITEDIKNTSYAMCWDAISKIKNE